MTAKRHHLSNDTNGNPIRVRFANSFVHGFHPSASSEFIKSKEPPKAESSSEASVTEGHSLRLRRSFYVKDIHLVLLGEFSQRTLSLFLPFLPMSLPIPRRVNIQPLNLHFHQVSGVHFGKDSISILSPLAPLVKGHAR